MPLDLPETSPVNSDLFSQALNLDRLEIIEVSLPQVESFRSAIGRRDERRALLIRWWDSGDVWGVAEVSCRPDPFYSHEFNAAVVELARHHLLPLLRPACTVLEVKTALDRIRGWPFTRAAVLDAAFDLVRRSGGQDAIDLCPPQVSRVPAGISLGIFDDPSAAVDRVGLALADNYRRVKLKVRPDMALEPLLAVRREFPQAPLAFDANGSCSSRDVGSFLRQLLALDPLTIEQPFPPSRLDWCAEAREAVPGLHLTLDESIEDPGDLDVALRLGAVDEVSIKPGRVGGQLAALSLIERCQNIGLPAWIGGMFEGGIGRAANLRLAARLASATAHDLSPSRRYFSRDIVTRPLEMDQEGLIAVGDERPVEVDWQAIQDLTVQKWELGTQ